MILGAIGLTVYNHIEDARVGKDTAIIEEQLEDYIFNKHDGPLGSDEEDYYFEGFDGSKYIGIVEIPCIGLRLPVYDHWDNNQLMQTPCLFYGSVENNHLVIGAHNYTNHLGEVRYEHEGETVYFYDIDGNRYKYVIDCSVNYYPSETEKLCESDYELTLFTCTYYGYLRVAIRCRRIY